MKHTIVFVLSLAALLASCEKDDDEPEPTPVAVNEWSLWAIPKSADSIAIFINGEAVEIRHDGSYPNQGYLDGNLQSPAVLYYPVETTVQRGDRVRVETWGAHEVLVGVSTVALTDGGAIEFTVYPY